MRSRYVVTYDISDDRRRDKVFRTLHGFGDHTQYSVFLCELDETELIRMRERLRPHVNEPDDQVLVVEIGPAARSAEPRIEAIGRAYDPPVRSIVI